MINGGVGEKFKKDVVCVFLLKGKRVLDGLRWKL